MRGLKPFLSLLAGCLVCAILSGCAGKAPVSGPGALNIAVTQFANGVIGVHYQQLLIATGGQQPYTWSISSGSLPPGLSVNSDGVISGIPTTLGTFNFTAKVVDSQTPTAAFNTFATSIMVVPTLSLAGSTLTSGFVGANYFDTISAANGLAPYTYSIAFGNLPAGLSLDAGLGKISGVPTQAGVFNFTVEVTDSYSEVATATFSLTIVGRLEGGYVIYFNGFDNGTPFYMTASFVADGNGNVTSGVLDQNGPTSIATNVTLSGTYSIPAGTNFGTMTLTSSLGTYQYGIVVSSTADSKLMLSDPNHPQLWGSGLVKKQQVTSISGTGANYSFGMFGNDSSGNRYGAAGMFALNASLQVTAGAEDTNDNGTASGELPITGGSFATLDVGTGRGIADLKVTVGGNSVTYHYVYYIASPTELVALSTDVGAPSTLLDIDVQQAPGATGGFTNQSLLGVSVVAMNGATSSNGSLVPDVIVGAASFDGNGSIIGPITVGSNRLPGYVIDESVGGTLENHQYNGTYNVDPNCGQIVTSCGRVSVNLHDAPTQPVWYMISAGQAFAVGTDPSVMSGSLQPQSGSPFTDGALLGSYLGGTVTPTLSSVTNTLDVASTPPPGGVFAAEYNSNGPAGPQMQQLLSGSYDCNAPGLTECSDTGKDYGRFEVTTTSNTGSPVLFILYIAGSGSAGATGSKTGLIGFNVSKPDGTPDPNPVLTEFGR